MKNPAKIVLTFGLAIAIFWIPGHALPQAQSNAEQASVPEQNESEPAPNLADIIPQATKLSADLAALKSKVATAPDVSSFENEVAKIEERLEEPAAQLQQIKNTKDGRSNKLAGLREVIGRENKLFEKTNKPLSDAIDKLGTWRNDWLAEKRRWEQWQSTVLKDGDLSPLRSTFARAEDTIEMALEIVVSKLNAMLAAQERAGHAQAKIIALSTELDALILAARSGAVVDISPPMFAPQYFSQYSSELWYALQRGLREIAWPDGRFLEREGLNVFLHIFFALLVIIAVYRNRQALRDSKQWWFLAARPISTGLFFSTVVFMWFYGQMQFRDILELTITAVAGFSFARIIDALNPAAWKKKFVYGLAIVLLATQLLQVIKLPMPLFRLYTVLTAIVGLIFCWRWAAESAGQKDTYSYRWLLRAVAIFLVVIVVTEIWGKQRAADFLFISLSHSTAIVLGFMLFMYIVHGALEWGFRGSSHNQASSFHKSIDIIIRRVGLFVDLALCGLFFLPALLLTWGLFDSLPAAIKGLLALGFTVGSERISVGLLIVSVGILYGSFLASWAVQKIIMDEVLARRQVEKGVRVSIARLVHYVFIFIGFLLALLVLGFKFSELTIILSAFGIGIGFGLQNIVNNLVSGLILLFERPVRVGDFIELEGQWAEIKKIGLRATAAQTLDQADVIIPNSDLISTQVVNWTLSNRRVRLIVPVGVAYDSDVSLVMQTLIASAEGNSKIATAPSPQVLFLNFGASSLDFELRVWVLDADNRLAVSSELHQEIDRRFREAKIEISFPQQDLHLRSVDASVVLKSLKTTG